MKDDVGKSYVECCRRRLLEEYLPKIRRCMDELSEEDLWWRAHETDNSIGNMLLHLSGNVRQWIISGIGGVKDTRERQKEFAERNRLPKAELLTRLESTLLEADKVLERFDTSKLMEIRRIQ